MAFSQYLIMQVTPELCTLLMFVPKAHPELQSMLINVQQFRPTWVLGGASATLRELYFTSSTAGKWEDESDKPDKLDEPTRPGCYALRQICPRQGELAIKGTLHPRQGGACAI